MSSCYLHFFAIQTSHCTIQFSLGVFVVIKFAGRIITRAKLLRKQINLLEIFPNMDREMGKKAS